MKAMKNKLLYFIFFYLVILFITPNGYYSFLPVLNVYPTNTKEVNLVIDAVKNRNTDDIVFFQKTDPSVTHAFVDEVDMEIADLNTIITSLNPVIFLIKCLINRARPYQIDPSIDILDSKTGSTPSYPAGHAFQAYYLAKVLKKKYPEKANVFDTLAKKCDDVRVKAGIHYPSDGEFAKRLVNILY
tara:strand:- start:10127 stop:10684 length:558 start_codon:yes stop_codon:yes gene_type:complete